MKKKIALLLVLAMVISLVPANLFAQPARMGTVSDLITASTYGNAAEDAGWSQDNYDDYGDGWLGVPGEVTVSVDMFRLRNQNTWGPGPLTPAGLLLRVDLTHGARFPSTGDYFRPLESNELEVWWTPPGAGNDSIVIHPVSASFIRMGYSWGFVQLVYHSDDGIFPSNMDGFFSFTMPISRVRDDEAHLVLRLGRHATSPELVNARIATFPGRGIRIVEGDVIEFEWVARLNPIAIEELVEFALRDALGEALPWHGIRNNHLAIRFVAPPNYFWSNVYSPTSWSATDGRLISTPHGVTATTRAPGAISLAGVPYNVNGTVHAIGFTGNASNWRSFPGTQLWGDNFANAWTYFRTPGDGRHELLFLIEDIGSHSSTAIANMLGAILVNNLTLVPGENAPMTGDVRIDIHAGILTCPFCQDGTTPSDGCHVVTGSAAAPAGGVWLHVPCWPQTCQVWMCNHDHRVLWTALTGTGYPQPVRTNVLVARRVRPDLSLSAYYDEYLPELRSGYVYDPISSSTVLATGATARVLLTENVPAVLGLGLGHPITFTFPEGVQPVSVRYRLYGNNGFGWTDWLTRGAGTGMHASFAGNNVTIRHDVQSSTQARELQVEFRVSVEAGFEARYGDTIEVRVDGSGAARLTENYVDVAEVWDPVTVTVGEPVGVEFVGRDNNIPRTPIGDIVITETRYGALAAGDDLWIYVARQFLPRPWDITLIAGDILVDEASGLSVQVVRNHRINSAGNEHMLLQLTVLTSSHTEGEEGRITLSGSEIFGLVYQDEIYYLAVTGNAIAENHRFVANHNRVVPNLVQHGAFDTMPYGGRLLVEILPDDGTPPVTGRANSLEGVVFSPTVAVAGVLPPVMWERLDGMTHAAGFLAARSFAYVVGADIVLWDDGTREAIIAGWNYQGEWVSVLLTQGSTIAIITTDGVAVEVDIAEYAGQSGPAGTLTPIFRNNRIYLPARFLFNAFGYSADYTFQRVGDDLVVTSIR